MPNKSPPTVSSKGAWLGAWLVPPVYVPLLLGLGVVLYGLYRMSQLGFAAFG